MPPSDEEHEPQVTPLPGQPVPIPVTFLTEAEEPEQPEPAETVPEPEPEPVPPEADEEPEPEQTPGSEPEPDSDEEPQPVQDQPPEASIRIDNVDTSVRAYIKAHEKWQAILFIPFAILWETLAGFVIARFIQKGYGQGSNSGEGKLFAGLVVFPFIIASAQYYRIKKQFEAAFLKQFADNNGFAFNATGQLDEAYGTIFHIQGKPTVSDIVSGDFGGSTLRLFLYELQIGKQHFADTVVELDLHGRLPNLMLIAKASRYNQVDLAGTFKRSSGAEKAVDLEGTFSDVFTLYCRENNEIEAREVFTPDIMQLAMDESKQYSIETVNNRIYIYANHFIGTTTELSSLFVLATKLTEKLTPLAGRMADDASVTVPPANAIRVKKDHPLVDKLLALCMGAIVLVGFGFLLYLAFIAKPASPQSGQPINPAYAKAITAASNYDSQSSQANNKGQFIIASAKQALAASKNAREKEYSNYWIGDGYFWTHDYGVAAQYEQTAITDNPKDPYPFVLQGNILVDELQQQPALADANQALHLNPNLATAYRLKAIALANLGQKQAAIQAINQATILDEGPNKSQFKSSDLAFYTYINNTTPPLTISP